jgi:hypothetical protein
LDTRTTTKIAQFLAKFQQKSHAEICSAIRDLDADFFTADSVKGMAQWFGNVVKNPLVLQYSTEQGTTTTLNAMKKKKREKKRSTEKGVVVDEVRGRTDSNISALIFLGISTSLDLLDNSSMFSLALFTSVSTLAPLYVQCLDSYLQFMQDMNGMPHHHNHRDHHRHHMLQLYYC